jgi:hypothetical protein
VRRGGSYDGNVMREERIIIHGGAFIPGVARASSPLAVLEADAVGVRVGIRSRRLAAVWNSVVGKSSWAANWESLDCVLVTKRSVLLVPRYGRGCYFGTIRSRRIRPLLEALATHHVSVKRVRMNWWRTIGWSTSSVPGDDEMRVGGNK